MSQFDQGEMGGGSQEEHEDRPPFLGEVIGEEKRRRKEREGTQKGNTEAGREESLDTERRKFTQPSTSFSSTFGTVDIEKEEEEQPGSQLTCLEIPDFLLSDAPEGNNGKQ